MNVRPGDLPYSEFYRILIGTVVPRPIAWVSTVNAAGQPNLAPFSFFNAICGNPPLLAFAPGMRQRPVGKTVKPETKDTLRNVRETGEFVVNMVSYELAEAMNLTSGEYDSSVNEFELAKLKTAPSKMVKVPRVAESPINFECKVYQIIDFPSPTHGGSLVIGEILLVHINDAHIKDGHLDAATLDIVGRMGGIQYTRTNDKFEMVRPK